MKKFFLLLLSFLFALLFFKFPVSALELNWPNSPFGTPLNDDSTLTDMIRYFYEWGIFLGGVLVLISFIIGGIQYISSAGNPVLMNEAKQRILSALIGLGLLLGIYLILNAINPELTIITAPSISGQVCDQDSDCTSVNSALRCENDPNPGDGIKEGICVFGYLSSCDTIDDCCGTGTSTEVIECKEDYECTDPNQGDGYKEGDCRLKPCGGVTVYDSTDFSGNSDTFSADGQCHDLLGANVSGTVQSIDIIGGCSVYLYNATSCSELSLSVTADTKDISKFGAGIHFEGIMIQSFSF